MILFFSCWATYIQIFFGKIHNIVITTVTNSTNVEPASYIYIIKPTGCQNNPGRVFPLDASASIPVLVVLVQNKDGIYFASLCNNAINTFTWWRHQMETFSASPVNSPHKDQWRGALMCSLICTWTNGRANNRDAGDLRRRRANYDVAVMCALNLWYWYFEFNTHAEYCWPCVWPVLPF